MCEYVGEGDQKFLDDQYDLTINSNLSSEMYKNSPSFHTIKHHSHGHSQDEKDSLCDNIQ